MASAPHPSFFLLLAVGAAVVWRIVVRVRRLVGRQRIAPAWPWLAVFIFPGLLLFVFMATLSGDPPNTLALVGGTLAGGVLGYVGLRLTRFDTTPEGHFYTPNAPIGLGLSALLVGRLIYRAWALYRVETGGGSLVAGFGQSPLTLAIFGLAAGYYATFAAGLLRWRHRRTTRDLAAGPEVDAGGHPLPVAVPSEGRGHPD